MGAAPTRWRCTCCGHYEVEYIRLYRDPTVGVEPLFRVTHDGYLVAYCRTVADVAEHVDLSRLDPSG